ncbi:hypothetical protein BASA60_001338 [Batrachochytrium salamandrivorans]|nr:hypothetical protein BASA60_001338 [Batrachochytrium salamandrivorans]
MVIGDNCIQSAVYLFLAPTTLALLASMINAVLLRASRTATRIPAVVPMWCSNRVPTKVVPQCILSAYTSRRLLQIAAAVTQRHLVGKRPLSMQAEAPFLRSESHMDKDAGVVSHSKDIFLAMYSVRRPLLEIVLWLAMISLAWSMRQIRKDMAESTQDHNACLGSLHRDIEDLHKSIQTLGGEMDVVPAVGLSSGLSSGPSADGSKKPTFVLY